MTQFQKRNPDIAAEVSVWYGLLSRYFRVPELTPDCYEASSLGLIFLLKLKV